MPNIKPISDLRNYNTVLREVTYGKRVYLTRNGQGAYALLDMKELDELDKQIALARLMFDLNKVEKRAEREGWINADDGEKMLGVTE